MGKVLNKAEIFKIRPVTHIEPFTHDDFPGITFGIKVMTAGAKEEYENAMYSMEEGPDGKLKFKPVRKDARLKLLLYTICDPNTGELLFNDEDLPQLREFPGKTIQAFFEKASEVNGIGVKEEETKNSQTSQESSGK